MRKRVLSIISGGVFVLLILAIIGLQMVYLPMHSQAAEKVYHWYPSTWVASGVEWDRLCYTSELINRASAGRIVVTPTAPGMTCAVEGQLDAVANGSAAAMQLFIGYFSGAVPVVTLAANPSFLLDDAWELVQFIEYQRDGRILKLLQEEFTKYGDVHVVGPCYYDLDMIINSTVPLNGMKDIKGKKFRTGNVAVAKTLGRAGASVVWLPGEEIYTNLSNGVIDACIFSGPTDCLALGFAEVAPYWIRSPLLGRVNMDFFVVNGKVWRELPDDLKAIVESAVQASNVPAVFHGITENNKAWAEAEENYGVKVIDWSEEDVLKWKSQLALVLPEYVKDEASSEALEIFEEFVKEWKPNLARKIFNQ